MQIIRYRKAWGITMTVIGGVNILLVILFLVSGLSWSRLVTQSIVSLIVLGSGIIFLTRQFCRIDINAKSMQFFGVIGPSHRAITYDSLTLRRNTIMIVRDGRTFATPLSRMFCNKEDFSSLVEKAGITIEKKKKS